MLSYSQPCHHVECSDEKEIIIHICILFDTSPQTHEYIYILVWEAKIEIPTKCRNLQLPLLPLGIRCFQGIGPMFVNSGMHIHLK